MSLSLLLRGGTVYDGDGGPPRVADVGVLEDRIAFVGTGPAESSAKELDVTGLVVAPGFINVLSQAWQTIQFDPTAASDVLQGVTTEVFGEAVSLGPGRVDPMDGPDPDPRLDFHRLSEGLDHVVRRGTAPNVASFLGGATLRRMVAGDDDRPLTQRELAELCAVVDEEMAEGALGIGTALIYTPGRYATTDELVSLCEVVGRHDGLYISHLRSETSHLLPSLDELIEIGRAASCRAEVYHLKAGGQAHHASMATAIDRITAARDRGQPVSANMYPYIAGMTALASALPPLAHEGGPGAMMERLEDPAWRRKLAAELEGEETPAFENLLRSAGGDGVRLLLDLPDGMPTAGRTLREVAIDLGCSDAEALVELVARGPSAPAVFFTMSEGNVELGLKQSWVSICSDAPAHSAEPPWTSMPSHPRTYGTFARFLRRYVIDGELMSLSEGVRRLTSLPADTLRLADRGRITADKFADVCVFDASQIADVATYEQPHQYATGVHHVVVNGSFVVENGKVASSTPGRRLRRSGQ